MSIFNFNRVKDSFSGYIGAELADGDTEDDSAHVRALWKYYKSEDFLKKGRPVPSWMPPDPRVPARAPPAQMVSSSTIPQSNYGRPEPGQSATNSLRNRPSAPPSIASQPSFIDSIPRQSQPNAMSANMTSAARLKAKLNRTGSPAPSQPTSSTPSLVSQRSSNPHESSNGGRDDYRPITGGSYGRDPYSARGAPTPAAQAAPSMSANAPWAGGGDEYNGFASYGSSSPFGDDGRGGGSGRQGLPSGPRSGMPRGPRGKQT